MFPSESTERLEKAVYATGDVEKAIDYIIGTVNKGEDKKTRHILNFLHFVGTTCMLNFFRMVANLRNLKLK